MRILIWSFVQQSPDSVYWHFFKDGLEALGHQVIAVDAFALTEIFGPRRMQDILLTYARAYRVQVALVVPQNFVDTDFLQALRAQGVAVVGYRYDDGLVASPGMAPPPLTVLKNFTYLDAACDLNVTICRNAIPLFASMGLPTPVYLPTPTVWPLIDATPKPQRRVIAYAGSPKYRETGPLSIRVAIAQALLAAGLPVELHHDAWATVPGCEAAARPTPTMTEHFDILRTSTVNLAISADWGPVIFPMLKGIHLEIAVVGGMMLTTQCTELDDYFTAGTDVAYAETVEDYVRQARYYLDHPEEARRLGRSARSAVERVGNWSLWWSGVAGHLATHGVTLDLDAPARQPDPAETTVLGMAATALAHAHEQAGKPVQAAIYYNEMLAYDPHDYSAHCGLARLEATGETARRHWQAAHANIGKTLCVKLPNRLNWPGIGEQGTNFAVEAAYHLARTGMADRDWDALMQAMPTLVQFDHEVAPPVITWLTEQGLTDLAGRCADLHVAFWSELADAWHLRGDIAFDQGRYAAASADHARGDAIVGRP
ncbi:MAG: glycosyltransferase [Candidatus Sericytochromatia bacterium]|nr:glycosyltransferase [Candidatus Sericytochromatia bacterium]